MLDLNPTLPLARLAAQTGGGVPTAPRSGSRLDRYRTMSAASSAIAMANSPADVATAQAARAALTTNQPAATPPTVRPAVAAPAPANAEAPTPVASVPVQSQAEKDLIRKAQAQIIATETAARQAKIRASWDAVHAEVAERRAGIQLPLTDAEARANYGWAAIHAEIRDQRATRRQAA